MDQNLHSSAELSVVRPTFFEIYIILDVLIFCFPRVHYFDMCATLWSTILGLVVSSEE
jgi:hypothetical protein